MKWPNAVRERLEGLGGVLDDVIASACKELIEGKDWSTWEVRHGLTDLLALSARKVDSGGQANGGVTQDCAYDRPSVGASYALWYHGRRTHEAVRALAPHLLSTTDAVRIVDIGCGTGAAACAVELLMTVLRDLGEAHPRSVSIDAADASPFMIEAAKRIFLALQAKLESVSSARLDVTFSLSPWTKLDLPAGGSPILFGGYLFDNSDVLHVDELAKRFLRLGDELDCSEAILLTAQGKRGVLQSVTGLLESSGWQRQDPDLSEPVWEGALPGCHEVRAEFYEISKLEPELSWLWRNPPSWSPDEPGFWQGTRSRPARDTLFELDHTSLLLDDEQEEAATPADTLTIVAGSAGSGKSRVLAERVVRTIEGSRPSAVPRILVTAFNKPMIDQLATWVAARMNVSEALANVKHRQRASGWWTISADIGADEATVTLINRDRLPHRVFRQEFPGLAPTWTTIVSSRTKLAEERYGVARVAEIREYLAPEFLEEELERVIYGRAALTREDYLSVRRTGRRKPLMSSIREVVWTVLMDPPLPNSFVHRRIAAYQAHQDHVLNEHQLPFSKLTHVFVDECQDFTESDFKLLACLPPDPQRLFVTGDESQSMHLGPCYRRPGLKRRQWSKLELCGSYRLPIRVCEAIEELALAFVEANAFKDDLDLVLAESRKAAVIGPRPIVVAGDEETLVDDLRAVLKEYRELFVSDDKARASVAEPEPLLESAIRKAAPDLELEVAKMRRIKGLERNCVLFSDRAPLGGDESVPEWVYTALTRSTSVLILILWADASPAVQAVLGRLRRDRLLFWSEAARDAFDEARGRVGFDDDPLKPA